MKPAITQLLGPNAPLPVLDDSVDDVQRSLFDAALRHACLSSDTAGGQSEKRERERQRNVGIPANWCQSNGGCPDRERHNGDSRTKNPLTSSLSHGESSNSNEHNQKEDKSRYALPSVAMTPDINNSATIQSTSSPGIDQQAMSKLVQLLQQSAVAGRPKIEFSLSLRALGEVRFDVRLDGKTLFVRAVVEDNNAAAALTGSLGELAERLRQCGLSLGKFDIENSRDQQHNQTNESETDKDSKQERSGTEALPKILKPTEGHELSVLA